MATLREYFYKASEQVLSVLHTVKLSYPGGELNVLAQIHFDFDAPAKYLSIFIPESIHFSNICKALLDKTEFLLKPLGDVNVKLPAASTVYGGFRIMNRQPDSPELTALPLCEPAISSESLPFTGTIFVYSENEASEMQIAPLKDYAKQRKLSLRWRGPTFARERSLIERPVAFISHDSRDKDEIGRPLAIRLQQMMCVWFDEFSLRVGESLRDAIEKGLKETAKCILILSPNFLANKRWTKVEFDSVFTREIIEERNIFLPVWHNVTAKDVYEYSPSLANRKGILWSLGIDEVARSLCQNLSKAAPLPSKREWQGQQKPAISDE